MELIVGGELEDVGTALCEQGFIGGDEILAALQYFEARVVYEIALAAHSLDNDVDFRVVEDFADAVVFKEFWVQTETLDSRLRFELGDYFEVDFATGTFGEQLFLLRKNLRHAAPHSATAKYGNIQWFHFS